MTIASFPPLISAIAFLLLGGFIFSRNYRSAVNRTFFGVCICTAWWQLSWFFLFNATDLILADILVRVGYAGIILIPVAFFHFFITFLGIEKGKERLWLGLFYLLAFGFELSLFLTDYFVAGAYSYFFGYYPRVAFLHLFWLAFLTFIFLRIVYLALVAMRQKAVIGPYKYYQTKYLFLALIFYTFSSVDFLVNYGLEIYPFGFIFILIFQAIVGYSIFRYRLLDIRLVARKIILIFGAAFLCVLGFYAVGGLYSRLFGGIFTPQAYLASLFTAPVFVLLFYLAARLFSRFANKYIFSSLHNYQETFSILVKKLSSMIDLGEIIDLTVNTIKQIMRLNRAGVLLIEPDARPIRYRIAKVIGFNEKNGISLVRDSFLTQYLEKTKKPLVRDELILLMRDSRSDKEKASFENLKTNMERIEASLCLPIFAAGKIAGIIVLGSKVSGDAYTVQDLEVLTTVAFQAGIAINNAILYKQVQDLNKNLEKKVSEQTKDLRQQAEHLKKLLEMRSEFLNIASHQLKTPVSVIMGTISMFREGSMDKLPLAKRQKFLDNIFYKTKKLNTIINDILRASEIDTENFEIKADSLKETNLVQMIKAIYDDFSIEAKIKKIKLELLLPRLRTVLVLADQDFLRQAISNLVDNAVKYTQNGEVTVELKVQAGLALIKVKDTGIGIPKTDQDKIFGKFNRAINAVDMYADGSGLGLFIVKKIIEAHPNGRVEFSSKLGKGSEFIISLKTISPSNT